MLAHLENVNIATVTHGKPDIVANCSVYAVLMLKYATILMVLPTRTLEKIGSKNG